ncbi:MAG: alpha/beta hydrolase [Myxococcota bacterium]|nr:alpha/beta hydrolase [Myxococcota bacterium]MEE2778961.1 alpha/beta hydrolase [Myxococcota bacterium]
MKRFVSKVMKLPDSVCRMVSGGKTEVDGQVLDGRAQLLLHELAKRYEPYNTMEPVEARAYLDTIRESGPPAPDYCSVEDARLSGASASGTWQGEDIPIRIYRPANAPDPSPALVYYHGGGWVVGGLDTHDVPCQQLAHFGGFTVVAVDYRLAPEHPFPAAISDATAAFRSLLEEAPGLGIDPDRLAVGGDSVGANLATVVCEVLRDEKQAPVYQLLVYPVTDVSKEHESYELFPDHYLLTSEAMRWFIGHYVRKEEERLDPRVSPLLAESLKGVAPACVLIAGFDPLRDEGLAYVKKLEEDDVSVDLHKHTGLFHGFFTLGNVLPPAEDAVKRAAASVRRALDAVRPQDRS